MIDSIVNKIIIGGIKNFALQHKSTEDQTQIRVYFDENKEVRYDACVNWQPLTPVTFRQILNKKLDMLGYEQLATPIFKKALLKFSEEHNIAHDEISVFIFYLKNNIGLFVFKNTDHVHRVSLAETLPSLLA